MRAGEAEHVVIRGHAGDESEECNEQERCAYRGCDQLHGGAQLYGIMLGALGMGAVAGALNVARVRKRFASETAVRACALTLGVAIAVVGLSHSPVLTGAALFVAGVVWMLSLALFNIGVQLSAPRWVAGRSLAAFQASIAGGVAFGSWGWGALAQDRGVAAALLVSGVAMLLSPLIGLKLRMPRIGGVSEDAAPLADPEVRLGLTARSGPIVVEIEYRIYPAKARIFYGVMQKIRLTRQRNGGYGWSIARDIADPWTWTERYHCPTWLDYLRMRSRATQAERDLQDRASAYHEGEQPIRIRRMLERPLGSVRWQEAVPDTGMAEVLPLPATPVTGVRARLPAERLVGILAPFGKPGWCGMWVRAVRRTAWRSMRGGGLCSPISVCSTGRHV